MACDPKTLAREASCFFCLPPGYYYPVKLAILARWLKILSPGADTSVAALMRDASCFTCPPNAQLGPMRLALICEATSGPAPPPAPPVPLDFTIDLSSVAGNTVLIWTDAGGATTIEIWKSVNGGAYALYDTVGGAVTTYTDVAAMGALDYWEYKIAAVGMSTSAFTTPAGAANGITDNVSVNISFPNLIISYDIIAIDSNAGLLTVSFPRLQLSAALLFFDDISLASLSVPLLGGSMSDLIGYNCTSLLAMSFPSLVTVNNSIQLTGNTSATTSDFGALINVGSDFLISNCPMLSSLSVPLLFGVGGNFDLNGNSSMASLTSTSLNSIGGSFFLNNDIALASIVVAALTNVGGDFVASNCGAIASVDFTSLSSVSGNLNFSLSFGAANINVDFPSLASVGGDLTFQGCAPNLQNINAPVLTSANSVSFSDCTGLLTVTLTSLTSVISGDLSFFDCVSLTSISLPALTDVANVLRGENATSLTTISLPVMTFLGQDIKFNDCTSLANVSIPTLSFTDGFLIGFDNCALSAASVNSILARGVASGTTVSDYELANGTNAAPSGAGIADKATLLLAGNTVNTN